MRDENNDLNLTAPLQNAVESFFSFLPELIGALLILVIGYFVAKFLKKLITKALRMARFDNALHAAPGGSATSRIIPSPSNFVGSLAFWLIWLGVISLAVSALNIEALNDLIAAIYGYIPNVIKAVLIFLVASGISAGAIALAKQVLGKTALANVVETVVPAIILSIATFMILNELQIATDIVNITYTAIMAALALGLGLAFGLGGSSVMQQILQNAYDTSKRNAGAIKGQVKEAKYNAQTQAQQVKNKQR